MRLSVVFKSVHSTACWSDSCLLLVLEKIGVVEREWIYSRSAAVFQNIFKLVFSLLWETMLANLNLFGVDLIITKSIIWNQIRLLSQVMIFSPSGTFTESTLGAKAWSQWGSQLLDHGSLCHLKSLHWFLI